MSKIKLTKGELKRQRDSLKQYRHYLPTLQLKKQQLQMKILEAKKVLAQKQAELETKLSNINHWVGLLADKINVDIRKWIIPTHITTETNNIAGANIPIFQKVEFHEIDYDFYETPFWLDQGILELRGFMEYLVEIQIVQKQVEILEKELRVTTQRVNLFEKVKIPECLDNIRRIRIYLGDQQANAVGIGKVAKKKVEAAKVLQEALV